MELLAGYGRLPYFGSPSRSILFVVLIGTSVILVTQIVISAILNYFNLSFSPFLLFIFQIYQSSNLIGWSHFSRLYLTRVVNCYQA